MIRVKLLLLDEKARKLMGRREMMLKLPENKATVRNLLKNITTKYGGEILNILLKPNISILLNGQYIEFSGGMDAKLSDGDRIAVISLATGG